MANLANFTLFSPPEADPKVFMASGDNASLSIQPGSENAVQIALHSSIIDELLFEVDVEGAGIVKVAPALVSAGRQDAKVYEITGKKPGGTIIDARRRTTGKAEASLSVLVREAAKAATPVPKYVPGTPLENFEVGFLEGLATVNGKKNLNLLVNAIKTRPGQFYAGYFDGVMRGLWSGVKDLFEGLAELGAIAPYVAAAIAAPGIGAAIVAWKLSDPEFRKKAAEKAAWGRSVAEAAKAVVDEFNKDPRGSVEKYLGASKDAGRKVGEAFAVEIDNRAVLGGPIEYGEWIGWVVGRIGFEVIVFFATEGIGDAVKAASASGQGLKGLRVVGEGAELFARVRSKIQEVLEGLPALKNFVETLAKTKSAAKAADAGEAARGAMTGGSEADRIAEMARRGANPQFIAGMKTAAPTFSAEAERALAKDITETMKRVGVPDQYIGAPDFSPTSKGARKVFRAGGNERGGCMSGQGIWVEGNVHQEWAGFPEWKAASDKTRLEAIVAHEYLEMKFHQSGATIAGEMSYESAHDLSIQLAHTSELKISPEARELLKAMRSKYNAGTVYLPPGTYPRLPPRPD